jgi:RES domain-containing protein
MMILYRVSRSKYAKDLSGEGARIFGGRWNYKGTPVIYAAESRSLAALEALVHMSQAEFLLTRKMISLAIPKSISSKVIQVPDLPKNWRRYPPPFKLGAIGTKWAAEKKSLLLRVPSAVMPHEFNVLINPLHPDMKHVKIHAVESFMLDPRLNPVSG